MIPLSLYDDALFVRYTTLVPDEMDEGHYRDMFHMGWMRTDGTGFQTLRTFVHEVWETDDEMQMFMHHELLDQVAARPCGGMVALILEEEAFVDWADMSNSRERLETHLVFYAADGTVEQETTLDTFFSGTTSMQALPDGRLVLGSGTGEVLLFSSSGELEQEFEAQLDSFVILHDGRMIATMLDLEDWEWSTRYFDLETGQIIESDRDVVPAAYRSPVMLPGIQYDLYSPVGDYMYGIDLTSGRGTRLFSWAEVGGHFHEFVLSERGTFYFFMTQDDSDDSPEGFAFRLVRVEMPGGAEES